MSNIKLMPWDGYFDNLYPSKKTSVKRFIYKITEIKELCNDYQENLRKVIR